MLHPIHPENGDTSKILTIKNYKCYRKKTVGILDEGFILGL